MFFPRVFFTALFLLTPQMGSMKMKFYSRTLNKNFPPSRCTV